MIPTVNWGGGTQGATTCPLRGCRSFTTAKLGKETTNKKLGKKRFGGKITQDPVHSPQGKGSQRDKARQRKRRGRSKNPEGGLMGGRLKDRHKGLYGS